MEFLKSVAAGVAGSVIFWLIDKQLLTLPFSYQVGGMAVAFLICASLWIGRNKIKRGVQVLSDNTFDKGLTATVDKTSIEGGDGVDVLSSNKVGGSAKIDIKDTTIKR